MSGAWSRWSAPARRLVRELLSGARGPRAEAWAWRVASLHPRLRMVGRTRRGEIAAPLQALRARGDADGPDLRRLRARLEDMAAFLARPAAAPRPAGPRRPFDGHVLFALHSCGAYDPTGYAARSEALLAALQRQGVTPEVAVRPGYPWDLPPHADRPRADSVTHRGLRYALSPDPPIGLRDPDSRYVEAYAAHLAVIARAGGASVVHASSNYLNGAAAALAAERLGIASVYEVRGLWHLTRAFLEPGYAGSEHFRYCEARELAACAAADHVVTLSPALRDWLAERGLPLARITVVGNAATPPAAWPDDGAVAAVRRRFGLVPGRRVFGYLGALVEYEGLDGLIGALARTPAARRPQLLLVGSGRHEAALRLLARRSGLGADVVFAGRVPPDEVDACYAAMDAVVLPRRDDPLTRLVPAIKPFEALAHDRALFVSAPLAQALGDTLPAGYRVIDVDAIDGLDRLFDANQTPVSAVPGWDDRARALAALYARLAPPASHT